jgi:hypothetical protein
MTPMTLLTAGKIDFVGKQAVLIIVETIETIYLPLPSSLPRIIF